MRRLNASELDHHIGKQVDITVLGQDGFDGQRFFYDRLTYHNATLLEYEAEERRVRFRTMTGALLFLHPLEIYCK